MRSVVVIWMQIIGVRARAHASAVHDRVLEFEPHQRPLKFHRASSSGDGLPDTNQGNLKEWGR